MTIGWLTPFDVQTGYAARRVHLIQMVASGSRSDYAWVRLDPPISPGEAANAEELEYVLLAPRHQGHPLAVPVTRPIHVYVCTQRNAGSDLSHFIDPDDVIVRHWGILAPSQADNQA